MDIIEVDSRMEKLEGNDRKASNGTPLNRGNDLGTADSWVGKRKKFRSFLDWKFEAREWVEISMKESSQEGNDESGKMEMMVV
jgi:hypothetical protein